MENNEKRPKRPRISESRVTLESQDTGRPMTDNAQVEDNEQRPYRPYNRPQQGGYNRQYNSGFNRPYNNYNRAQGEGAEGQAEGERPQQSGRSDAHGSSRSSPCPRGSQTPTGRRWCRSRSRGR